jgi:N-acetylmuramoyl-L-alanine amidase
VRVLKSGSLWLGLLVALAGCSTAPRPGEEASAPNWGNLPPGVATNAPAPARPAPVKPVPKPAPAPAPAPTNQWVATWMPLERWTEANGLHAPQRMPSDTQAAYAITTPHGILTVKNNTRAAYLNGMELQLGFPPEETNGHFSLRPLELDKTLSPLLGNFTLPEKDHRVIVIDPGHGGTDTGTKSVVDGRFEKEFTLDLAKRLVPLLEAGGWTVFLTRTNDATVALTNRVTFADAHHADLFISLHFNSAAPDEKPAGVETFCATPSGMPSTFVREWFDDVTLKYPNNNYDIQNLQLAIRLHRAVLAVNGHLDGGIRRARFLTVVRGQNRPAVLIEGGFLSNPREARHIADPAYRQKLAVALAGALTESTPAAAFRLAPPELRPTASKP